MTADLSSLSQVRRLAAEILAQRDRLDVLVNNAGVISPRRQLTADGLETTFATNHLGPFLLTSLLRELLERSAPARAVTVSSAAHQQAPAICLHPGFVRTALGRDVTGVLGVIVPLVLRLQPGPATGAQTLVYLASSPEVAGVTGGYFVKCRPARPSALARDDQAAARLWALSEELTGLSRGH